MKKLLNSLIVLTIISLMSGIASAQTNPNVPDAGTTSSLVVIALGGLTILRRFVR